MSVTQETLESSELINWTIFQELLLMDEDEEGFALSLVQTFVDQASGIFKEIEALIEKQDPSEDDLKRLASLGHYLKGSAAALGLHTVQQECERIQNYGNKINLDDYEPAAKASTVNDWIGCIQAAFKNALDNYEKSKELLSGFFGEQL
ncbi:hypothetical protein KL905_000280 [Ogataea polymorpha]|uniref:Uncharacterized protein n=1 Tax=Ogataea polymorpha TaxID=460523 RepID=A0A1B7SIS5_9ASCO|nr:uncharacterized protein OGAPODRAFT_16104 [Ogataea polymorpha]KAG7882225.1 hypothetical protein KL937_000796 [Ogataea polymorpha]KAG7891690.1 hypothetical protein KL936_001633 [Ogataea polymorpha]KAG7895043.1 hypothetical protein KL908_001393 [Ogataea polymorpha]KAG7902474.1 hypothetical protein KL935_001382 [Ogataea polymorpha]KAG7911538.1 hypothetical protein KL906_000859 [Ogataea polymorpha]